MTQVGGCDEPEGRPDATGGIQASVPDHKRKAVAVAFDQESPQAVWRRGIRGGVLLCGRSSAESSSLSSCIGSYPLPHLPSDTAQGPP
eukprot:11627385-Alexandrium_andersonii.AAC.1